VISSKICKCLAEDGKHKLTETGLKPIPVQPKLDLYSLNLYSLDVVWARFRQRDATARNPANPDPNQHPGSSQPCRV
jgi:hypothetical protein